MVRIGTDTRTDNKALPEKVHLRNKYLPDKEVIDVLDAFSADGVIWKAVEKLNPDKSFCIARIDNQRKKKGFYIRSENTRFLRSTDLNVYDVIDLDHYGVPFNQLEVIFNHEFTSKIELFATFNLVGIKPMHKAMLRMLGFSDSMLNSSRYLCSKNSEEKILSYLNFRGVNQVDKISYIDKAGYHCYMHFTLGRRE